MQLTIGQRVAFTAKHCKMTGSACGSDRRGTYQGLDKNVPGYCRVIWDSNSESVAYADDAEYMHMARTEGELHPVGIICGVKSAKFGDSFT